MLFLLPDYQEVAWGIAAAPLIGITILALARYISFLTKSASSSFWWVRIMLLLGVSTLSTVGLTSAAPWIDQRFFADEPVLSGGPPPESAPTVNVAEPTATAIAQPDAERYKPDSDEPTADLASAAAEGTAEIAPSDPLWLGLESCGETTNFPCHSVVADDFLTVITNDYLRSITTPRMKECLEQTYLEYVSRTAVWNGLPTVQAFLFPGDVIVFPPLFCDGYGFRIPATGGREGTPGESWGERLARGFSALVVAPT